MGRDRAVIESGQTRRGEDWQPYVGPDGPGIYIDVDTAEADFPRTPTYISALYGSSAHWNTVGASSIYNPTETGFRVYIRRPDGGPITPDAARVNGWYIAWISRAERR